MLLKKLYFLIAFAIEYPKKRLHIYFNSSFFVVIIDITSLFHYNLKNKKRGDLYAIFFKTSCCCTHTVGNRRI